MEEGNGVADVAFSGTTSSPGNVVTSPIPRPAFGAIVAPVDSGSAEICCLRQDFGVGTVALGGVEGWYLWVKGIKSMLIQYSVVVLSYWLRAPVKGPGRGSWHQSATVREPSPELELCAPLDSPMLQECAQRDDEREKNWGNAAC